MKERSEVLVALETALRQGLSLREATWLRQCNSFGCGKMAFSRSAFRYVQLISASMWASCYSVIFPPTAQLSVSSRARAELQRHFLIWGQTQPEASENHLILATFLVCMSACYAAR